MVKFEKHFILVMELYFKINCARAASRSVDALRFQGSRFIPELGLTICTEFHRFSSYLHEFCLGSPVYSHLPKAPARAIGYAISP